MLYLSWVWSSERTLSSPFYVCTLYYFPLQHAFPVFNVKLPSAKNVSYMKITSLTNTVIVEVTKTYRNLIKNKILILKVFLIKKKKNGKTVGSIDKTVHPSNSIYLIRIFFLIFPKTQNHTYSKKTRPNHKKNISPDTIPTNNLPSNVLEFKQLINSLFQLLTTVIN